MHVRNASLKNHDAGWELQRVRGQQPGRVPEEPYPDGRRKTRQDRGPPGPEQWIQLLQEEGDFEGPGGSSHLPEHPRHRQILPADIPSFLHIFQLDLLVSVCLGAPNLCLVKATSRPLGCTAWYGHLWGLASCPHMDLLTMSPHRAAAPGPPWAASWPLEDPRSPPAVLPQTSWACLSFMLCCVPFLASLGLSSVLGYEQFHESPLSITKRLKCLPGEYSENLIKPRILL